MNITEARIDHLSDLARLSLPGGEKERAETGASIKNRKVKQRNNVCRYKKISPLLIITNRISYLLKRLKNYLQKPQDMLYFF